jgi:tetratricopeptide (TPR) repeat protein
MLVSLLQTPSELVSREALWKQLWPEKNAEDSDRSLRVAATKLRQALGDSSTAPRLIETVPRRGYRFIGTVTPVSVPAPASVPQIPLYAPVPPVSSHRKGFPPLIAGLLLLVPVLVLISAGLIVYKMRQAGSAIPPSVSSLIVVGGVKNSTGQSDLDGVLAPALQTKMEESPYLNLGAEESFRRLARDADATSLPAELKACADIHASEVVGGEILSTKSGYQFKLSAWRCPDGRLIASQSLAVRAEPEILAALDSAAEQMRLTLGEPRASVQKFSVPVSQAMTGSLGALKAFTQGERKHLAGMDSASIEDYKLAVALDPHFALAYARLGAVYTDLEEYTASEQSYRNAFELRDRTTERQRFYISSHYFTTTGEIALATNALKLWREMYPRDPIAANNLGDMYDRLGDFAKALEQIQAAVRLNPNWDYAYTNLVRAELRTGNYAAVARLCNSRIPGRTDSLSFRVACFQNDFVHNDANAMRAELEKAKGDPAESQILANAAWISLYRGQMKEANRLFNLAEESARRNNLNEFATEISLDQAGLEADLDLPEVARQRARASLQAFPNSPHVQAAAALALARSGDESETRALSAKVAAEAPADTILNDAVLSSTRAAAWMQLGNGAAAVRELERARPYDFCSDMEYAPAYYRGLAYLQQKRWSEAIGEFKRVLAQRVSLPTSPYLPLSELAMGRAWQLSGNSAEAARAYEIVAETWKSADPEFGPLRRLNAYRRNLAIH